MATAFKGIIRGKNIELTSETGLPDGLEVTVKIQSFHGAQADGEPPVPWWIARLDVNPAVRSGKFVVRGTRVLADELVSLMEEGWGDEKLLHTYAELVPEDVAALREYAQLPQAVRHRFGAWADDADELDEYLQWNRQQRQVGRKEIAD